MFGFLCLLACLALCQGYAVPLAVPVSTHVVPTPVVSPYLSHGYHGYGGITKPLHYILKRSAYYGAPLAHVAPVVVSPVAVSHQARVDYHSAPAVVAASLVPVVKTLTAPLVSPLAYGVGHYGSAYGSLGHY